MLENILCLQVFSLNVLKFDLYVLKQSIFRALKRDLERAYLMIVGKSSHFTSCFIDVVIYAQPSFASACEAWIPKNDCRHIMHSSFVRQLFSILIFMKWKRAFCELYRQTFERGACYACLQVVHSRTFPWARARSRSKFTKVRSKKINSFESESSLLIFTTLKLIRSLWKQVMEEVFVGMVRSRAVFVNELQTSVLDLWPCSRQTRTANFAFFSSYPIHPTEKYTNIFY